MLFNIVVIAVICSMPSPPVGANGDIPASNDTLLDVDVPTSEKVQAAHAHMTATDTSKLTASSSTQSPSGPGTSTPPAAVKNPSRKCRPGTSFYETFGLPAPPETPECYVSHTYELEPWDSKLSTRLYHHVCPQQFCRYNTAAVSKYFTTPIFMRKAKKLKGLMVDLQECSELEIGANQTIEFSSVRALVLNFWRRQDCDQLNRSIPSWKMPQLGFAAVRGGVLSKFSEGYFNGLFNGAKVQAIGIYDSRLCLFCKIFEGKDLRELTTLYLFWANPEEEFVVQRTKEVMNGVDNVEHFGSNVPLATAEFGKYMARFVKLKTGNFTVKLKQREGRASFPLSTTFSSNVSQLEIHLNITNRADTKPVVIYVQDSSKAGQNLGCIRIHSPGNVIRVADSLSRESICWEHDIRSGKLTCCRA